MDVSKGIKVATGPFKTLGVLFMCDSDLSVILMID